MFSGPEPCEMQSRRPNAMQFALAHGASASGSLPGHDKAWIGETCDLQSPKIVQLARCTKTNLRNRMNTYINAPASLARPLRYVSPRCLPHISANEKEVPCVSTASSRARMGQCAAGDKTHSPKRRAGARPARLYFGQPSFPRERNDGLSRSDHSEW